MKKTTVYLPDELKEKLATAATECGMSEAEYIRASISDKLSLRARPKPTPGIFALDPTASERVDELLEGFGEH